MPFNHCWGCGADNPSGLRIKSRWEDQADRIAVATFEAGPAHWAGPKHVLNGGIVATVLDCHAICTAIADAYAREGRGIGEGEPVWFATGSITVRYVAPAPVDRPLLARARIGAVEPQKTLVSAGLFDGEALCASADVVAVRVPPSWLEP
jgi:acyl-coenzyme A thioesterase PaaI-like protein